MFLHAYRSPSIPYTPQNILLPHTCDAGGKSREPRTDATQRNLTSRRMPGPSVTYTIRNKYPLPLIPDLISQVKDATLFSKFDVRWGYNNIRIKEGDQHKAAFKTKYGLYEPNVMFFGLTNSPATFQAMMDHILQPWGDKWEQEGVHGSWYMDDVLVASKNKEKHQQVTHELLDILEANDLFLKPEKCVWEQPRVDYLGLILEGGITRMEPAKVAGIATWPTPTSVKQVQSFLGFCNFYRPFIYQFSHIAKPLNELTRKDTPWTWEKRQQEAFETLRKRITSEPVLKQPQLEQQFKVEVDASGYAIGVVLMQRDEKGKRHPVAYFSSTLNEAKRNYDIYTLELYAIVRALRHWRPFLAGSPHEIIVHTNHANLQYWKEPQKVNRRIAREVVELSEYNIKLKNIPGRENGRADMLSRRLDYDQGEQDNQDVVVLPEELFIQSGTISYIPEEPPQQDEGLIKQWAGTHDLKKINREWWKDTRKVITGGELDRHKIIQAYHDVPAYGHPGISRTKELVAKYYWWPQLAKDVQEYVKGCAQCQQNKVNTRPAKAPLNPISPTPEALPFQTIAMDFIVKLPESAGYDSILTITDHDCTKMLITIICTEKITAEGVAEIFLRQVFPRFGLPSKIISDRDPRFISKFMKELCRLMGITQNVSTAYHPRTDGQSERSNQWLEQYLRFWVDHQQTNWHHYLPLAEFTHNSWRNETTGQSPFEVLMGYSLRAEIFDVTSSVPTVALWLRDWKKAREDAQKLMIKAQKKWTKGRELEQRYKTGDLVWLEGRNLQIDRPSTKLAPKRYGPFKIGKVLSPITYQVELPQQWKIHDVFHADLLTPYHETELHGPNFTRPPPDLIDGEEEYEVEEIVQSQKYGRQRKVQYLIKWKGCPALENQWVDWDDIHADEALTEFRRKNPDAVSHIKRGVIETAESSNSSHMSNDDSSTPLATISGANLPLEVRELFLNWRPTVPSSWTTPPESKGENTAVSTDSSPIRRDYYQPQTLILTNITLHAAHTPYTTNLSLSDHADDSSEDSFPCPTPEVTNINAPSPDPIPIPPQPLLESEHTLGPVHSDPGTHDPRPTLQVIHLSPAHQEAEGLRGDTGGTPPPGTDGVDGHADEWEEANKGVTWEDYGPKPQVLVGYTLNEGADYIPFDIRLPSGEMKPTKYIKLEYSEDPLIHGMIDRDPHQYVESLQATPFPSAGPLCTYTSSQLELFKEDHDLRPEVDSVVYHLYDKTVMAEVECYRINRKKLKCEYKELRQIQHDIWKRELMIGGCAHRMAGAQVYQRIEVVNRACLCILVDEYKARHRGRRH